MKKIHHILLRQIISCQDLKAAKDHFLLQEEARSDKDALGALLRHPLASPVGGKVSDSGMGFLLLGFLLEKVFDMPLDEAAKRFVTAPLHMNHTNYDECSSQQVRGNKSNSSWC